MSRAASLVPRTPSGTAPGWAGGTPVPVAVKVEKVNPAVEVAYYDTLTLDHTGQELTAVRFRVADDGSVTDVSRRDKSLIQLTRSVRRSGK